MALAENQITLEVVNDGQDGAAGPQGDPGQNGADGKSAYESAQEGGYSGTETQFNADLADVPETKQIAENTAARFYHDENGAHVIGENYRTDVKDGLKIVRMSDEKVLATFMPHMAKIGEDSTNAEIQLCGGAGVISYDGDRLIIDNAFEADDSVERGIEFGGNIFIKTGKDIYYDDDNFIPRIVSGSTAVTFSATGTPSSAGGLSYFTKKVTEEAIAGRFHSLPIRVVATIRGSYSTYFCHVNNITLDSFDVVVTRIANNAAASTVYVDWVAVGR